jgi:hypothetical protein
MDLIKLLKEIYLKSDCNCGCGGCKLSPTLTESNNIISENLQYHINKSLNLYENEFRIGSKAYMDLFNEARELWKEGKLKVGSLDESLLETNLGEFGIYEGEKVPLDMPMVETNLNEAEYKGKKVQLGKPKRGGSKKFYVYVKDPKTKKIKKVSFGGTTGLSVKINDPKARQAFAARHKCSEKTDRTKPSYWSCRIGRYWKQLGGEKNFSGYW